MNCKQGDLAVVVKSDYAPMLGRIVTCVRFHPSIKSLSPQGVVFTQTNAWEVDINPQHLPYSRSDARFVVAPDSYLRPLRDTDGDDETLTWAGKPSTIDQPTKENA